MVDGSLSIYIYIYTCVSSVSFLGESSTPNDAEGWVLISHILSTIFSNDVHACRYVCVRLFVSLDLTVFFTVVVLVLCRCACLCLVMMVLVVTYFVDISTIVGGHMIWMGIPRTLLLWPIASLFLPLVLDAQQPKKFHTRTQTYTKPIFLTWLCLKKMSTPNDDDDDDTHRYQCIKNISLFLSYIDVGIIQHGRFRRFDCG